MHDISFFSFFYHPVIPAKGRELNYIIPHQPAYLRYAIPVHPPALVILCMKTGFDSASYLKPSSKTGHMLDGGDFFTRGLLC
jgi:hypothetical protein